MGRALYHYSAVRDRASIIRHGLLPRHPADGSYAEQAGNPVGVYLLGASSGAFISTADDLWEVTLSDGWPLHEDPLLRADGMPETWYTPRPVPPAMLRRLHGDARTAAVQMISSRTRLPAAA